MNLIVVVLCEMTGWLVFYTKKTVLEIQDGLCD